MKFRTHRRYIDDLSISITVSAFMYGLQSTVELVNTCVAHIQMPQMKEAEQKRIGSTPAARRAKSPRGPRRNSNKEGGGGVACGL